MSAVSVEENPAISELGLLLNMTRAALKVVEESDGRYAEQLIAAKLSTEQLADEVVGGDVDLDTVRTLFEALRNLVTRVRQDLTRLQARLRYNDSLWVRLQAKLLEHPGEGAMTIGQILKEDRDLNDRLLEKATACQNVLIALRSAVVLAGALRSVLERMGA
jgi:hypothetical protein